MSNLKYSIFSIIIIFSFFWQQIESENITYRFGGDETVNYDEAKEICENWGMRIIELKDRDEFNQFYNAVEKNGQSHKSFWIGLKRQRDYYEGDVFAWENNGERVTFSNWAPGEPTNHHNYEDCVYAKSTAEQYLWNDNYCMNPFHVACYSTIAANEPEITNTNSIYNFGSGDNMSYEIEYTVTPPLHIFGHHHHFRTTTVSDDDYDDFQWDSDDYSEWNTVNDTSVFIEHSINDQDYDEEITTIKSASNSNKLNFIVLLLIALKHFCKFS